MENNMSNKKYTVKETVAYYIFICDEMYKNNEEITLRNLIKKLAFIMKKTRKKEVLEKINIEYLQKILFTWEFNVHEVIAYAFAVFYVLINRKEKLTEEKIVNTMLSELYSHKPKKTIKEAEFIAGQVFPELLE